MKEKRKTRLNKTQGTKAEFLGFGAFADAPTVTTASSSPASATATAPPDNNNNNIRWSPIYIGKDDHLASLVFPRLIKRDTTTKVKALQELQEHFQTADIAKKRQVDALAHYVFLYHSKLVYDSASSVRAEALLVLTLAATRVPKAFATLTSCDATTISTAAKTITNRREVLGMMYCCHGDPAAEVRAVASKYFSQQQEQSTSEAFSLADLQAGIWEHVERILSYGRANKMHDDLFSTSLKSSNSKKDNKDSKTDDLNESQRDQLEERFERIVGTALSGMQVWIQRHGILSTTSSAASDDNHSNASSLFLWKTLSSPKASLRIRTYQLLATACQKAPEMIFASSEQQNFFCQALPQALASEKEPGNIPSLLEALLVYLASYTKFYNSNNNNNSASTVHGTTKDEIQSISNASSPWDNHLNAATITKHLVKLFKKSCYGASATQWGPTLLPLLAMLPTLPDQVAVLTAAWKGRDSTVRLGDHMVVVRTVSESASFFLLRKQQPLEANPTDDDDDDDDTTTTTTTTNNNNNDNNNDNNNNNDETLSKELAQLWLDCLSNFLETNLRSKKASSSSRSANNHSNNKKTIGGPLQQAQNALGQGLAEELQKFDEACDYRPNCALYAIRDWFWSERLHSCILEANTEDANFALAIIIQNIMAISQSSRETTPSAAERPTHLSLILQRKFRTVLSKFQQSSGAVPSEDAYELMIAILKHCGIQVLQDNGSEDADGSRTASEKFLMNDVLRWIIVHTSLLSTQQQNKALARDDFTLFGICMADLPSPERRSRLWGSLLKEVIAAKCHLELLIAGLTAILEQDKISVEDIKCDHLDQFTIQVVQDAVLDYEKIQKLEDEIHFEEDHNDKMVTLKEFLQTCCGLTPGIPAIVRRPVLSVWVDKACPEPSGKAVFMPTPLLETLLLLAPTTLETQEVHRVLLQLWAQGGQVWETIGIERILKEPDYLRALFDQAPPILKAMLETWSRKPQDPLAREASIRWSQMAWRLMSLSMRATIPNAKVPRPSLALVNLADLALWEAPAGHDFAFSCLMYLLRNEHDPMERLKILQNSVESDPENLIVGILLSLSEANVGAIPAARTSRRKDRCAQLLVVLGGRTLGRKIMEKLLQATASSIDQFVLVKDAVRLRRGVALVSQFCDLMIDRAKPQDIFSATDDGEDLDDEFEREKVAKIIVPLLKKERFESLAWSSSFAELVNVMISQCGVGAERGIGSLHYDVFQLILGAESRLRNLLEDSSSSKDEDVIQTVWVLALSCGFGLNSPASIWNTQLLMFQPDKITNALLDFADARNTGDSEDGDFDRALFVWLMTCSIALQDNSLRERAVRRLCTQCSSLLSKHGGDGFAGDTLLALRGIHMAQITSRKTNLDMTNLETQLLMQVLGGFTGWESSLEVKGVVGQDFCNAGAPMQPMQPCWQFLSEFPEIVSSTLVKNPGLMVAAAAEFTDGLVEALFVESKRWYAFRLLNAIAQSASVMGDATPEEATARRLKEWTKQLDEEARGELEEDVEIICEIFPHRLMLELESWSEEDYHDTVDDIVIKGRMFVWLCCLQYIDAFVRKDSSNRPSLCTYIDKSGALEAILNLTILYTGVIFDQGGREENILDVDQFLREGDTVDESTAGSLVFFRTIEALPSLSRRWWEEECPKVYSSPMREYISTNIAPLILRSELERLKLATIKNKFGAMTVTGSVNTREICALYTQDEIQLKVMIRLPPSFPLRNAEVDCSQTLGVPVKRWKLWSLQITMVLNNEGGTLQEALMLWKENVDKEFEGVEPCPVCYSVLHVKTHKLPELECTTCSNRFHSQCLTQWFRSSGKTLCVLCQQPWSGTRVKK